MRLSERWFSNAVADLDSNCCLEVQRSYVAVAQGIFLPSAFCLLPSRWGPVAIRRSCR